MLHGVIFDMDGVLLNNLSFHLAAWRQLGRELGKTLSDADIRGVFGQRNLEMLTNLIGLHFHEEEARRHAERKEQLYRTILGPKLPETMVPGLLNFLQDLSRERFRVGLATSGPVANVEFVLAGLAIDQAFHVVVTGDDVSRSKPDPEIFLLTAERLGLPAQHCAVFEDSYAGVESALNARCLCVALSTTHNRLELESLGVHHVIPNFKAISVDMLRGIYKSREASLYRPEVAAEPAPAPVIREMKPRREEHKPERNAGPFRGGTRPPKKQIRRRLNRRSRTG